MMKDLGAFDLDGFKKLLIARYGNIVSAWRIGIDIDNNGAVSWQEFCTACHNVKFRGPIKTCWDALTQGREALRLQDLDPASDELIKTFCDRIASTSGNLREVWRSLTESRRGKRIDLDNFSEVCENLRFTTKEAKKLFRYLDVSGDGALTEDEVEFLAVWDVKHQGKRRSKLKKHAYSTSQDDQAPPGLPFDHQPPATKAPRERFEGKEAETVTRFWSWVEPRWRRIQECLHAKGLLVWEDFRSVMHELGYRGNARILYDLINTDNDGQISQKELLEFERAVQRTFDLGACTLEAFQQLLAKRYGCCTRAFRTHFGGEEHGKIFWRHWCTGCTRVAYQGSCKHLWEQLDPQDRGYIELRAVDPQAYMDLSEFAAALLGTYGTPEDAWRWCFDLCRSHRVTQEAFDAICDELGFAGFNGKRRLSLFRCLDADDDGCITEKDLHFLMHFKEEDGSSGGEVARKTRGGKGKGKSAALARTNTPQRGRRPNSRQRDKTPEQKPRGIIGTKEAAGFAALSPDGAPFVFEVVVTRDEYKEFLERKKAFGNLLASKNRRSATPTRTGREGDFSPAGDGISRMGTGPIREREEEGIPQVRSRADSEEDVLQDKGGWDLSTILGGTAGGEAGDGEPQLQLGKCPLSEILPFTWDDHRPGGAAPKALTGALASATGAMRAGLGFGAGASIDRSAGAGNATSRFGTQMSTNSSGRSLTVVG